MRPGRGGRAWSLCSPPGVSCDDPQHGSAPNFCIAGWSLALPGLRPRFGSGILVGLFQTRSQLMSPIARSADGVTVISDRPGRSMSGYAILVGGFVLLVVAVYLGWASLGRGSSSGLLAILIFLLGVFVWKGLYVLQPNYSAVLQLFGSYIGTDATTGLRWVNPFYSVTKVSRRVQTIAPRPDNGEREDQGERPEWESHRDRGRRHLARAGRSQGHAAGRELRHLRADPIRDIGPQARKLASL